MIKNIRNDGIEEKQFLIYVDFQEIADFFKLLI